VSRAAIEQEAFSPREVAIKLGVHHDTVLRWIRSGQLPSFKLGGARFIRRDTLDEVMAPAPGRAKERYPAPIDSGDEE